MYFIEKVLKDSQFPSEFLRCISKTKCLKKRSLFNYFSVANKYLIFEFNLHKKYVCNLLTQKIFCYSQKEICN